MKDDYDSDYSHDTDWHGPERRHTDQRFARVAERLGLLEYKMDQIIKGQEYTKTRVNILVGAVVASSCGVILNALYIHIH